jgi:hypothetical protein
MSDAMTQRAFTEFEQAFEHLGWTEGRDFRIDYRGAAAMPTGRVHSPKS